MFKLSTILKGLKFGKHNDDLYLWRAISAVTDEIQRFEAAELHLLAAVYHLVDVPTENVVSLTAPWVSSKNKNLIVFRRPKDVFGIEVYLCSILTYSLVR